MCQGCYEDYERPSIVTAETLAASTLVGKVFDLAPTGGNLHTHLDDWNLEDEFFDEFKVWRSDTPEEQLMAERSCFDALKAMSLDERVSAIALYEGYITSTSATTS